MKKSDSSLRNEAESREALSLIGFQGEVLISEELKKHASLRIGGPADLFLVPSNKEDLLATLRLFREKGWRYFILGEGTNLLISDAGVKGTVIKTFPALSSFSIQGNRLQAEAGCSLSRCATRAQRHGLSGLEFCAGLPGTIGGAVAMNAGCWGKSISEIVSRITVLRTSGKVQCLEPSECDFSYRDSRFQKSEELIIEAEFRLANDSPISISQRMDRNLKERKKRFPVKRASAGCIFKNPAGETAGYLIEAAGLMGTRSGDAEISNRHANFIVNRGDAKAEDVIKLIKMAQKKVLDLFSIKLELEIKIWE